jgi:hypothetical protein
MPRPEISDADRQKIICAVASQFRALIASAIAAEHCSAIPIDDRPTSLGEKLMPSVQKGINDALDRAPQVFVDEIYLPMQSRGATTGKTCGEGTALLTREACKWVLRAYARAYGWDDEMLDLSKGGDPWE